MLIENAPGSAEDEATPSRPRRSAGRSAWPTRRRWCSTPGTFEAYQGLDLLFEAMAIVRGARPDARLVLAGGKPDQVARARASRRAPPGSTTSRSSPASGRPTEIPAYLLAADVLVSPRSRGTNTPLKIYQYLRSADRSSRRGC